MRPYVLLGGVLLAVTAVAASAQDRMGNPDPEFKVKVNTALEPVGPGPWAPTVESLSAWECPEWFRDAKFGIWAHWGPQCAPEDGDEPYSREEIAARVREAVADIL